MCKDAYAKECGGGTKKCTKEEIKSCGCGGKKNAEPTKPVKKEGK
jgi:hypothetical protein